MCVSHQMATQGLVSSECQVKNCNVKYIRKEENELVQRIRVDKSILKDHYKGALNKF